MKAVLLNKLHSIFQVFFYSEGLRNIVIFCAIIQNLRLTFTALLFILILASHLQQNKQCLAAHVGSNLAVPMVSGLTGCYAYCFFVWQLMLYFAGANIIIKGEKTVCC